MKKFVKINLDEILEKTASIRPISDEEISSMHFLLKNARNEKELEYFEKLASEDEELGRKEKEDIDRFLNIQFQDLSDIENGEFIKIPEVREDEATLTPCIVFKNIPGIYALILTNDARYKVIKTKEDVLCIKDKPNFKFSRVHHSSISANDEILLLSENKIKGPFAVTGIREIKDEFEGAPSKKYFDIISTKGNGDFSKGTPLIALQDVIMSDINSTDACKLVEKRLGKEPGSIERLVGDFKAICFAEEKGVIKLNGKLGKLIKRKEDFYKINDFMDSGVKIDNEKVAFTNNTVLVECVDRKGEIFNLNVQYRNTDKRMMNIECQKFNRITIGKTKAILRILKFDNRKVQEIITKSKNEPRAILPLPQDVVIDDIKRLQNGEMINLSKENLKKNIRTYANPADIMKNVALATSTSLLADAAFEAAAQKGLGPMTRKVSNIISKFADDSKEMATSFEKLALENKNEYLLDMAKVNTISAIFLDKVAEAINSDEAYVSLGEISKGIVYMKPIMEKMAFDLTGIKVNSLGSNDTIISNYTVNKTIQNFDNLYKTASAVNKSFDINNLSFDI